MPNVIFLFPNVTGHINRVIKIAKGYQDEGNKVYFASTMDLLPFTKTHGFEHYPLNSLPFALGFEDHIHKEQKYLESLLDRFKGTLLKTRRIDIQRMLAELNPSIIFLDSFNFSDFIHLYGKVSNECRVIQIQTKFPMHYNPAVPPLNTFAMPSGKNKWHWAKYYAKRTIKRSWDRIRFFGKSDNAILKEEMKKLNMNEQYPLNTTKVFHPTFDNLEEWFLVPKELDFPQQNLHPWQQYKGSTVDFERKETVEKKFEVFLEGIPSEAKLIYVSLGTVDIHLKKKDKLAVQFFNNIINIAEQHPTWYLIIAMKEEYQKEIKVTSKRIVVASHCPQLTILKQADLFLTHSGNGSILEAFHFKVPMLLFPLNKKWDQNGTAARLVFHKLGVKSDFKMKRQRLNNQIESVLREGIKQVKSNI